MGTLKRILVALLTASMLCAPLVACKKQNVEEPSEESSEVQGVEIDLLEEPIVLSDAKNTYYRIVRPGTTLFPITDAAAKILEYPANNGARNLKLNWTSDKNEAIDAEILVGYTNRPESLAVLQTLDHDDFAIRMENGKIVVAAHTPERLTQAVEYLCENLLQIRTNENGQKEFVYLGNYTYTGSEQYLFNKENELKNYSIVYKKDSAALKKAAETFQKYVNESYGVELPVVDDSTPETACEFLFGDVNRTFAKEYLQKEETKSPIVYLTVVKNKKLLFATQNEDIAERSIEKFCKKYITPEYSFLPQLPASLEEIDSVFDFSETTELAEGANLRVMSFNILCERYAENAVIEGRQLPVVAPIFTYMPDVLGMQEVTDAWYPYLYSLFGDTYKIADQKDNSGGTNWSPLAYNTKTLTLLDHGAKRLQVGGNGHRVMSWGYFERKSDGARFVVINTHWNVGGDANKVANQVAQAKEMADFALFLKDRFNCPVITTGDYNSRMSEQPVQTYLKNSGLLDAGTSAKVINRAIKTTHDLFSEKTRGEGEAIDHIFASSDVELLYYNVLIDKCLAPSSDHYPIYVDIKLNK